jgi:peptidoglycan/xylan/chitin deacetylase (PgdA/CDA1 family)
VGGQLVNLTFHGVGPRARDVGPGEEAVWLTLPRFLSILDVLVERPDVVITFDDGNASDVTYALPALVERGLGATFFIVAGRLDEPGFVGGREVRELATAGMRIGCHGMSHRAWRGLDVATLDEEIGTARHILEETIEAPVTRAACPFGAYDRRVVSQLRRHGYETVYTSDGGTAAPDSWLQPRNTVRWWECGQLEELLPKLEQRPYSGLGRRARLAAKRWR